MTTSRKALAILLSIVLAFSCFTMAVAAANETGIEQVDSSLELVLNILKTIETYFQKVFNFIRNIFGITTNKAFYDVEVVHNEFGSVVVVGNNPVVEGTSFVCDIFPIEGYYAKTILFNDEDITGSLAGNRLVTPNVTTNTTLTIVFDKLSFTVSVSVNGGGSVTPNNNISVPYGETAQFEISPYAGQELVSVLFNGADVTAELVNGVFTTPALYANATLVANFEEAAPENVIYVAPGGTGDGSSWASPMGNIQAAVNAADESTQVWLLGGEYTVTAAITAKAGVAVFGGFSGTEVRASDRAKSDLDGNGLVEPWEFTNASVLKPAAANISVVITPASLTKEAIFDGFTFTNSHLAGGQALVQLYSGSAAGARGILRNSTIVDSKNTNTIGDRKYEGVVSMNGGTVDSCYFANNDLRSARYRGGAISAYYGSVSALNPGYITNSKFVNNIACYGGAVYVRGSNYNLSNNIFVNNTSTGDPDSDGGGVFFVGGSNPASGTVEYNTFIGNTADLTGGGLYMKSAAVATRNLFLNNNQLGSAQYAGDGTFTDNMSSYVPTMADAGINSYYLVNPDSQFFGYGAVPVGNPVS